MFLSCVTHQEKISEDKQYGLSLGESTFKNSLGKSASERGITAKVIILELLPN